MYIYLSCAQHEHIHIHMCIKRNKIHENKGYKKQNRTGKKENHADTRTNNV